MTPLYMRLTEQGLLTMALYQARRDIKLAMATSSMRRMNRLIVLHEEEIAQRLQSFYGRIPS